MEKLSGVVIDAGDDYNGAVLRSIFPTQESVPDLIKSAEYLPPERRAVLPDDLYALVLQNGEDVALRKFACTDAGNTALSVEYFMKTAHKLPENAQKVAAANLCEACSWYDIEPPEVLEKIALAKWKAVAGAPAALAKRLGVGTLSKNPAAALGKGGSGKATLTRAFRQRRADVKNIQHGLKAPSPKASKLDVAITNRGTPGRKGWAPPGAGLTKTQSVKKEALGLARAAHLALVGPEAYKTTKHGIQRNMAAARQSGSMVNPNVLGGTPPPTTG